MLKRFWELLGWVLLPVQCDGAALCSKQKDFLEGCWCQYGFHLWGDGGEQGPGEVFCSLAEGSYSHALWGLQALSRRGYFSHGVYSDMGFETRESASTFGGQAVDLLGWHRRLKHTKNRFPWAFDGPFNSILPWSAIACCPRYPDSGDCTSWLPRRRRRTSRTWSLSLRAKWILV